MRNGELQLGTLQLEAGNKQAAGGYAGENPQVIEFSDLPKQALPEK